KRKAVLKEGKRRLSHCGGNLLFPCVSGKGRQISAYLTNITGSLQNCNTDVRQSYGFPRAWMVDYRQQNNGGHR
ncbi:MAG: hypothetical protein ACLRV9_00600, partial [Clostridium sp.]